MTRSIALGILVLILAARLSAEEEPANPPIEKPFEIGDRQAVDAFSSLEDGTPGDPGETEGVVTGSWYHSRETSSVPGGSLEIKHTMRGDAFWKNMELSLEFEGERARMQNENGLSLANLGWFEAGKASQSQQPVVLDLPSYLAARGMAERADEGLRPVIFYELGQSFYSPQPVVSFSNAVNFQAYRILFDPHSFSSVRDSWRLDPRQHIAESDAFMNEAWLERWVKDGGPGSWKPTVSTVVELGLPLADKAANGENATLTLAVLKTFEFGTVIANAFGTTVVGNADRTLRSSIYGGRLGFRHDIEINGEESDYRFNLIGALVHTMSDVRHEGDSNTLEFAVQYLMPGDMSIGPGIAVGLDQRKSTPRFTFGLRATF